MKEILMDTSAWDAIEDASDPNHDIALLFKEETAENYRLVTTSYILDETYTLLLLNSAGHSRGGSNGVQADSRNT
jgi:predicted nucleic acid-binding protein